VDTNNVDVNNLSCDQLRQVLNHIRVEGDCLLDAEDVSPAAETPREEWLSVLEEAMLTDPSETADAHAYFWLVAELLVSARPTWPTMNIAIPRLFGIIGANINTFNIVRNYAQKEGWQLSVETKKAILIAFESRNEASKFILKLDGYVREVLRNCE